MPPILRNIPSFQVLNGRLRCSEISNHPPTELLYRLKIKIRGLDTDPLAAIPT